MKRFQNKVAESRYALPLMAMYALGIWLLGGLAEGKWYPQFAMLMLSTYLMVELNNTNALLHMYSRMVSCTFLALTSMAVFLFPSVKVAICMLSVIMFCTLIFHTYQDKESPGLTYFAFLCLGIASCVFIQIVLFVPFIWLMMAFYLMAFSSKMLWASLLGLITPYWFTTGIAFYLDKQDLLITHFKSLISFQPIFDYSYLTINQQITFVFVLLMALISIIHYLWKNRLDRIRTRMIYHFFIMFDLLIILFIILQPQHFSVLFGLMIVCTSPLIAHFIAHTQSRLSNITFYGLLLITLLLTALNLWTYSSTF